MGVDDQQQQTFWLALASIFGGAFVKIGDWLLGFRKTDIDEDTAMRAELRSEIARKDAEIRALAQERDAARRDADEWRSKYWHQRSGK